MLLELLSDKLNLGQKHINTHLTSFGVGASAVLLSALNNQKQTDWLTLVLYLVQVANKEILSDREEI